MRFINIAFWIAIISFINPAYSHQSLSSAHNSSAFHIHAGLEFLIPLLVIAFMAYTLFRK